MGKETKKVMPDMSGLDDNKKRKNCRLKIEHWHIIAIYLIIYDIMAANASYFFALLLRFDMSYSSIPQEYFQLVALCVIQRT